MKLIRMGRLTLAVAAVGLGLTLATPAPAGAAGPAEATCALNGHMNLDSGVYVDPVATSGWAGFSMSGACAGTVAGITNVYGSGSYSEGGLTSTGSYSFGVGIYPSIGGACYSFLNGIRAGTALTMNAEAFCDGGQRGQAVLSLTFTPWDSYTPYRFIMLQGTLTFAAT